MPTSPGNRMRPAASARSTPTRSSLPDNATGQIRVADASVVEGNSGTSNLIFTVYRAGGLGSERDGRLHDQPRRHRDQRRYRSGRGPDRHGELCGRARSSATVTVPWSATPSASRNETLSLTISNPTGNIAITDAIGIGTIVNDDFVTLTISQIQGAGHTSPLSASRSRRRASSPRSTPTASTSSR